MSVSTIQDPGLSLRTVYYKDSFVDQCLEVSVLLTCKEPSLSICLLNPKL